eukprot:2893288-Karenia_brevis.AAC.1
MKCLDKRLLQQQRLQLRNETKHAVFVDKCLAIFDKEDAGIGMLDLDLDGWDLPVLRGQNRE